MAGRTNCPSCGTRFTVEAQDRFVTCPACGRSVQTKTS